MVRLRACYFFNVNQRVWVKSWRYLHFRKIIPLESAMSKINAVLSFLASTPANNTANTESVMKKTVPTTDTLALLRAYDQGQIASQQAEINRLRAALAAATVQVSLLKAESNETLEAVESERRWFNKNLESTKAEVSHWKWQAEGLCNAANNNAAKANKLADKLDEAEEAVVIANNWRNEALKEANRQARLADAFRNIARSSKGRSASKFALPAIEGEIEAAELAFYDRLAIDKAEDIAESVTPTSRKLVGFGADSVEGAYHCRQCRRVEAHRGHRNGHVPMTAREIFHYLNR